VTKAVFPVAGLGTRFLPATKASPKEMLPVVDKPIIQYAVEEAIEAGVRDLVFVTGRTKRAIEDHFDRSPELELELEQRGSSAILEQVRSMLPPDVTCIYIRQPEPLGLGHAVLCAKPAVGENPFAVILPDDLIHNPSRGCIAQMVDAFSEIGCSMVAVEDVDPSQTHRYGVVSAQNPTQRAPRMDVIVEKPAPEDAPSNLGVVGRYLLTPRIFELLASQNRGAGGEIQLTDSISRLLALEPVHAFRFSGRRYDCGSKIGFLEATVRLALEREDLAAGFKAVLASLG